MWRWPAGAVQKPTGIFGVVDFDSTFAALGNGQSYTSIVFTTSFVQLFDVEVFMDQAGTLQLQTCFTATGTFRNMGNALAVVANTMLTSLAQRVPNLFARWVLTAAGNCAITELVIVNRSL